MAAPIMYISARMVLITYASKDHYASILNNTRRDVMAISLACIVSFEGGNVVL